MYRSLPVWLQWAIPFGIAAAVVIALVVFVEHQTNDVSPIAGVTSKSALIEENREDTDLVREQQAPHVAKLGVGQSPADGLQTAVVRYMHYEINHGEMDGPVKSSSCHAVGSGSGSSSGSGSGSSSSSSSSSGSGGAGGAGGAGAADAARLVMHCDVTASDVTYPFYGVVQPSAKQITYCQRVAPPIPSLNIPVSKRCT